MRRPPLIEQILVQISGIPADFAWANEISTNLRPLCDKAAKFPDDNF